MSSTSDTSSASKRILPTLIKVVIAVAVIAAFLGYREHRFTVYGTSNAIVGEVAPAFELPLFNAQDETLKLSDYEGQVVLIDFWATWCKPCVRQVRALRHVSGVFADEDVHIISVNTDEEDRKRHRLIHKFVHANYHDFPIGIDDHRVQIMYNVERLPTMILVGRDGTIRRFFRGVTPATHIKKAIRAELKRPVTVETSANKTDE